MKSIFVLSFSYTKINKWQATFGRAERAHTFQCLIRQVYSHIQNHIVNQNELYQFELLSAHTHTHKFTLTLFFSFSLCFTLLWLFIWCKVFKLFSNVLFRFHNVIPSVRSQKKKDEFLFAMLPFDKNKITVNKTKITVPFGFYCFFDVAFS